MRIAVSLAAAFALGSFGLVLAHRVHEVPGALTCGGAALLLIPALPAHVGRLHAASPVSRRRLQILAVVVWPANLVLLILLGMLRSRLAVHLDAGILCGLSWEIVACLVLSAVLFWSPRQPLALEMTCSSP